MNNLGFKVGGKVYCHTTGRMRNSGEIFALKGESYIISEIDEDGDIWIYTLCGSHYWGCINNGEDIKDMEEYFVIGDPLGIVKHIKKHVL
jgi:hypothetical protein